MRGLRFTLTLLFLIALGVHAPLAQETAPAKSSDAALSAGKYDYLVFYMGSRIGWAKDTISGEKLDGRDVLHEREDMWIQIKRSFDGKTFETVSTTDSWYEPDGTTIKEVDVTKNGGQTVRTEIAYGKKQITVTETVDKGKPVVNTIDRGDKTVYGDLRAWQVLKENKQLAAGNELKFWSVDADNHMLIQQTWTVSGPDKRKLSDDSVAEGTCIKVSKAGKRSTLLFGKDDMPLTFEDMGGFTIERTKEIPEPFKVEAVSLRNVMTANVAIEQFQSIKEMQLHFKYEHDDGVPVVVDTNRYHDVIKYKDGYALRLKSQRLSASFKSPAYPLKDVPEDVKRYLNPTAMCQSGDDVLCKQARQLAGREKTAVAVARAIMNYTDKRLRNMSGSTGGASARQAFDERKGDCTEHAALFVALARAAGLPARNIGGFVYAYMHSTGKAVFGYHAWAEVWIGKWVPVDATVRELGTSARYVMFEVDEPGDTRGNGRSARCLRQGIHPVIDAYTMANGDAFKVRNGKDWDWSKALKPYVEPKKEAGNDEK